MRTLAILPVKSFGAAKQRLSDLLGQGSREALAQAMFSDVLAALRRVKGLDAIAVVTDDPRAESAARGGRVIVLRDRDETGQSDATRIGIQHALECGVRARAARARRHAAARPARGRRDAHARQRGAPRRRDRAGPRRHRARTRCCCARRTRSRPASGRAASSGTSRPPPAAGIRFRVERVRSLMHDVDTPDDLADLGRAARRAARRRAAHARRPPPARPLEGVRGAARAGAPSSQAPPPSDLAPRSPGAAGGAARRRPRGAAAAASPRDEIVVVSHKVDLEGRGARASTSRRSSHPRPRARWARRTPGSRR